MFYDEGMKITILAYGSRGDVQPYVALGLALKARGHAPCLAVPENFTDFVRSFGLEAASIAGDTRALMDFEDARRWIWEGRNLEFFLGMRRAILPVREKFAADMLAACRGASGVLSSPVTEFIAPSVAEAVGARCALSFLAPQVPSGAYAPIPVGLASFGLAPLNRLSHAVFEAAWWRINRPQVNQARRGWGLAPQRRSPSPGHRKRGSLVLMGYSAAVAPPPPDWSENLLVTGAWQLPAQAAAQMPGDHHDQGFLRWLEEGPPPVYFGFGSMPVPDHAEFMEMAAEVCEELGMRALIGAGWNDVSAQACDLPDNLAVVEQADHAWLFSHCAAAVHHGGAGTTQAALSAGLPSVVCSFFADQPYWGRRVEALGAGRHFHFRDISPRRLKRALQEAISEGCQARASELAAAMAAEGGAAMAAGALEKAFT